jgi:hypothetical protein
MRGRGHRCKTKEVNAQSFLLAAADACQLITQKSHSQPAARTAWDGLRGLRYHCVMVEHGFGEFSQC